MNGLLNIGEMGALALHAMAELAAMRKENQDARISVPDMAERLSASTHTLHKVVTKLVATGLVDSVRGPSGGIRLTTGPEEITLLQIIETVDRKLNGGSCLFTKRVCPADELCPFSFLTRDLEGMLSSYFTNTTLAKLLDGKMALAAPNDFNPR